MKEHFPILMWAEMFQTSPQFTHVYGPREILVAIEKCLRGDQNPWSDVRRALGDKPKMMSLTNQPHRTKAPMKRPQPDIRSETAAWSAPSTWKDWSEPKGRWTEWSASTSSWTESGWRADLGMGASHQDAPSATSEEQSDYDPGRREAEGSGQSRRSRTTPYEGQPVDPPPWRQGRSS